MCEPISLTTAIVLGAGVAASAAGAYVSYSAGQDAAAASRSAQQQAAASQNAQFMTRMQAQQEQLAQQSQVNTAAAQRFSDNQARTQQAQVDALDQRQGITRNINTQEAALSDRANQAVSQATQAVSPSALTAAQADQQAQEAALNQPIQANIQASNPLGAAGSSGPTHEAMESGKAAAEKYTQAYGDNLARLSSYSAPITTAGRTATTLGTNLMPVAAADQLLKTSAPALLAPSAYGYQSAGQFGQTVQQANELQTQSGLALAADAAQNKIDLANLNQGDTAATIQGNLNIAQANAAAKAGLGAGVTQLGLAGINYAGGQGAFSKVLPKPQTTAIG